MNDSTPRVHNYKQLLEFSWTTICKILHHEGFERYGYAGKSLRRQRRKQVQRALGMRKQYYPMSQSQRNLLGI